MRLNNGVSKVVSLGLTILVTLLSLLLLFGVTDTVKEIISVSRGSYSSYSALENGGEAYADEADRLNMRLEEEAAAMHDEECRKEIDEIIRKGVLTCRTEP